MGVKITFTIEASGLGVDCLVGHIARVGDFPKTDLAGFLLKLNSTRTEREV